MLANTEALSRPFGPKAAVSLTLVAIGASSGGLEASTKLIELLPIGSNLAVILVQHFDPNHESLMADLLASHTAMTVAEATEGMVIASDHVYVIPPGQFLRVSGGKLTLSAAPSGKGARLPFDALLASVATEYGAQATCCILSGNGADGSVGLVAIKEAGGQVYAQDPAEAEFNGMPHSAIATGKVDHVDGIAAIAGLILAGRTTAAPASTPGVIDTPAILDAIIALLLVDTGHDFSLYKRGTIQRRVERRMALAGGGSTMSAYLESLRGDKVECGLLADDLLINVTSFFRDPQAFKYLEDVALPELIAAHEGTQGLRIWCAGCSSGEETYSLAMLLSEAVAKSGRKIGVQLFASDVDADAITLARAGQYPPSIAVEVSQARLDAHFSHNEDGYRVSSELRAMVVFSVQDILRDPPFSRLDMISCRNVLIYLGPEAQTKALSLFGFALKPGGLLLLGSAETTGASEGRFALVEKAARLYRQIGRSRDAEAGRTPTGEPIQALPAAGPLSALPQPSRSSTLAELCRRLVLEYFAPAAMLIDAQGHCVYSMGPTDKYLQNPKGYPTSDPVAMVPPGMRPKLKAALQKARSSGLPTRTSGGRNIAGELFDLDIHPVEHDKQTFLFACFVEPRGHPASGEHAAGAPEPRIAQLERDLEAVERELKDALHDRETTGEEQKAIDEEAMSVAEEYQSTNEELLTSKEELQSLNEELTALNGQLQETLERQKTTSNDLQNVLYSTDLATIFLDTKLNIRFFTPATRALFNVIAGDIGRPLSDLNALSSDSALLPDAEAVLKSLVPIEREVEARTGAWFIRRVLPYRTQDGHTEGVVITFANITERRHTAEALARAEREARTANIAKSRFLAAASHDLRQPLQSLKLVHGLLAKTIHDEKSQRLLARLDETVGAMAGMLNSLLDINQIEAGVVQAKPVVFPIEDLLRRLYGEYSYLAKAQGLSMRVVHSRLNVVSDPRLLEQMIRNLLANALKYTQSGKVLLGCRRSGNTIRIEVWDTGIGIAKGELKAIFDEYHQIDNAARERSRGLGLGLSIVKRLGDLLKHPIDVRSTLRRGSGFAVSVPLARTVDEAPVPPLPATNDIHPSEAKGTILVVEDDPEIRDLLELLLTTEGHRVVTAADGHLAVAAVSDRSLLPDVVVADFNLPNGMDGVETIADIRATLRHDVPAIILTGDISTLAITHIGLQDCQHFTKPIRALDLTNAIAKLLSERPPQVAADVITAPKVPVERALSALPPSIDGQLVYVVDDDPLVGETMRLVIEQSGRPVELYASAESFLAGYRPGRLACLVVDAYLPGMNGIDLVKRLSTDTVHLPAIMITGSSDVSMAVAAMKAGAVDFIEKPVGEADLLGAIAQALELAENASVASERHDKAALQIASLTQRQRQIMDLVLAGHPNKNIAADLKLSQRTVENHRAAIMQKTGAPSLPALARLAMAATVKD